MRSAPAVTVLCTGGRLWQVAWWMLPASAATALCYWVLLHAGWVGGMAVAAAALAGGAVALLARRRPAPAATLCWDGAIWTCGGVAVRPQVMMDSGSSWMLLRLHAARVDSPSGYSAASAGPATPWLAVCERDAGPRWHAFRAAVYCPEPLPAASTSARPKP